MERRKRKDEPAASAAGAGTASGDEDVAHICPECGKKYGTLRGLQVHRRKAHQILYHKEVSKEAKGRTHVVWKPEEMKLLARIEARLEGNRGVSLQRDLAREFSHRTVDQIKGVRKKPVYQNFLEEARAERQKSPPKAPTVVQVDTSAVQKWAAGVRQSQTPDAVTAAIVEALDRGDKDAVQAAVDAALGSVTAARPARGWNHPPGPQPDRTGMGNRKRRKYERRKAYREMQRLYKKNRSMAAENALKGEWCSEKNSVPKEQLLEFWRNIFDSTPKKDTRIPEYRPTDLTLIEPFEEEHIEELVKSSTPTAPGPDGLKLEDVKRMSKLKIAAIFNGILFTGRTPTSFLSSRTVLIPKTPAPIHPGEYRPISISSALCRLFHKGLAKRFMRNSEMLEAQRAFREIDGTAVNVVMLNAVMDHAKQHGRPVYICFIDVKKAFDSVSHDSIHRAVAKLGAPMEIRDYLKAYYAEGTTLVCGEEVPIRNGVRQGDPLSPMLFNMIIDEALVELDKLGTGYDLDGTKILGLAFADDIAIVTSTQIGMETAVKTAMETLRKAGLEANPAKCATLSLVVAPKTRKWAIDDEPFLSIEGTEVKAMSVEDDYKYLGLKFSGKGVQTNCEPELNRMIDNLTKAPLKPQQRLYILRNHLVPKLLHSLVLSQVTSKMLKDLDYKVRHAVRRWVALPHDASLGFMHGAAKDGGLGIPSLRTLIPRLQIQRLDSMKRVAEKEVQALVSTTTYNRRLRDARRLSKIKTYVVTTKESEQHYWRDRLLATCDGKGLRNIGETPGVNNWVVDGTSLMQGANYIKALKIRGNLWATGERSTRGRCAAPKCPSGCPATDCLGHILQSCDKTHDARVKRHDFLRARLAAVIRGKGHTAVEEVNLSTPTGLRRPDILVRTPADELFVLDVQVTSDANVNSSMTSTFNAKKNYYNTDHVRTAAARALNFVPSEIKVGGAIWTWRGALCKETTELLRLLQLTAGDLKFLTVCCLEGSIMVANVARRRTTKRRSRVS